MPLVELHCQGTKLQMTDHRSQVFLAKRVSVVVVVILSTFFIYNRHHFDDYHYDYHYNHYYS